MAEDNSDVGEGSGGPGGVWTWQSVLEDAGIDYDSLGDDPFGAAKQTAVRKWAKNQAKERNSNVKRGRENRVAEDQEEFTQATDPFSDDPEQIEARNRAIGMIDPDDLSIYGANDVKRTVTPEELMAGIEHQDSPWLNSRSSFGDIGPSAWEGDESAFGDLAFDEGSLEGMGRSAMYFDDLTADGTDAISEADYQRRVADAEQVRRANLESAIQSAEMRGQGGVGDRLLAELSGAQASASDIYQAGLDANALAARRRDAAALSGADIYDRMGQNIFGADVTRAGGMDAFTGQQNDAFDDFNTTIARGKDAFTADRNSGLQSWMGEEADRDLVVQGHNAGVYGKVADRDQERGYEVNDNNTDAQNNVLSENSSKQERLLGVHMGSLGMEGGQVLGQGDLDLGRKREKRAQGESDDAFGKAMQVASFARGSVGGRSRYDEDD